MFRSYKLDLIYVGFSCIFPGKYVNNKKLLCLAIVSRKTKLLVSSHFLSDVNRVACYANHLTLDAIRLARESWNSEGKCHLFYFHLLNRNVSWEESVLSDDVRASCQHQYPLVCAVSVQRWVRGTLWGVRAQIWHHSFLTRSFFMSLQKEFCLFCFQKLANNASFTAPLVIVCFEIL